MAMSNILFLVLLVACGIVVSFSAVARDTCAPDMDLCEIWLEVSEVMSMMHGKDLVYPSNGRLIKYDEFPNNFTTQISPDDVITADGVKRLVHVINGSLPGPPLVVYEGQRLKIHVKNRMLSKVLVMHWHGLHQRNTPWMDGVDFVTQCPIAPHQSFTYTFDAYPKGTFWYHSHVSVERANGVIGALIIKERPVTGVQLPKDMIMTVGDWHHKDGIEFYTAKNLDPYIDGKRYVRTFALDGGKFTNYPFMSSLIEGRGEYIDPKTGMSNGAPLSKFTVSSGEVYRFRVINVGMVYPVRVSVDGHNLTMVASDGYDFKPRVVQSFVINSGERFDFLLKADKLVASYWIRTDSIEIDVENHTQRAILTYDGAADGRPTSTSLACSTSSPCMVMNCPYKAFPLNSPFSCLNFEDLEGNTNISAHPLESDSKEHFLNFGYPGHAFKPGSVNGRRFISPQVPLLTQPLDVASNYKCENANCGVDKICECSHELVLPYQKTIQLIFVSRGNGKGAIHPIHLHGHGFQVLKLGYPLHNDTTGKIIAENPDIDCGGDPNIDYCNAASFVNGWTMDSIPGMKIVNPIVKDTIVVPIGGYVVVRIRSDNPGKWFLHCHVGVHNNDGMAMVINEAPDQHPLPPKGFPICGGFYGEQGKDVAYVREGASMPPPHEDSYEDKYHTAVVFAIILAVMVLGLIIAVIVLYKRKNNHSDGTTDAGEKPVST